MNLFTPCTPPEALDLPETWQHVDKYGRPAPTCIQVEAPLSDGILEASIGYLPSRFDTASYHYVWLASRGIEVFDEPEPVKAPLPSSGVLLVAVFVALITYRRFARWS